MPQNKRPRPRVPLLVRINVITRQLHQSGRYAMRSEAGTLQYVLATNLRLMFGEEQQVALDHQPPLRVRAFRPRTGKYTPDANDPEHLIYRTVEDHKLKTNVRGDHGQFPDRVLIKRERKRERGPKLKPKQRLFGRGMSRPKHTKIPARQNPWPPKGSRKLGRR